MRDEHSSFSAAMHLIIPDEQDAVGDIAADVFWCISSVGLQIFMVTAALFTIWPL